MEKVSKIVTQADIVGIQLRPTLCGKNRIKSCFGGLISLVVIACILFGFGYFGISMINRDKPIMNLVHEMRSNIAVPTADNPFVLAVYDKNGEIIHNNAEFKRAVKIEAEMHQINSSEDSPYSENISKTGLISCSKANISRKARAEYASSGYNLDLSLCHDDSSFKNHAGEPFKGQVELRNRYGELNSSYIYYKFTHCDEQADPGCLAYFKSIGRITVMFIKLNYFIDPTDYNNPVKFDLNQGTYFLAKNVSQTITITTKINELLTDSSFFLSKEEKKTFFTTVTPNVCVGPYEFQERLLLKFVTSLERVVTINQRRYMKIPELLANMGGFMKAAIMIGNLLSYFYSEYAFYIAVNKLEYKSRVNVSYVKPVFSTSSNKSSVMKLESSPKMKITQLPSFFEYLRSLLSTSKERKVSKTNVFKYLELSYLIDCLSFVEQIKKQKENNLVTESQ